MDDLISRQAAIDELEKGFKDVTKGVDKLSPTYGLTKAVTGIYKCLIGKLPSAQPMRGRWIEYNYPGSECVYCDQCKTEYYPDDLFLGGNDYPNFCPNCGADMRQREE